MPFGVAAVFAAAVGQHARELHVMALEQRDHAVIDEIGGRDRRLSIVEFGANHLAVGVDEGLLVDPPNPLHVADIERILGAAVARMLALELAVGFLFGLGFLQRDDLRLGQHQAVLRALGFQRLEPLGHGLQVVAQPHAAHAGGDTASPRFLSSLATRTWPKAGCSTAIATMASSTSCGTRFFGTGFLRLISCKASSPPWS